MENRLAKSEEEALNKFQSVIKKTKADREFEAIMAKNWIARWVARNESLNFSDGDAILYHLQAIEDFIGTGNQPSIIDTLKEI